MKKTWAWQPLVIIRFHCMKKKKLIQHPLICLDISFVEWLMSRKEYISHCHPTNKSTTNTLLKCAKITPNTYKCLHVPKTDTKPFLRTPQTAISQVWVMKTINSSNYLSKSQSNMLLIDLIDWASVMRSSSQTGPCKKIIIIK